MVMVTTPSRLARNNYYLISYDLEGAKPEEYAAVDCMINKMHGVRILQTVWIIYIRRSTTVEQVANSLQDILTHDDKLVVIRLGHRITSLNFETFGRPLTTMRTIIQGLSQSD